MQGPCTGLIQQNRAALVQEACHRHGVFVPTQDVQGIGRGWWKLLHMASGAAVAFSGNLNTASCPSSMRAAHLTCAKSCCVSDTRRAGGPAPEPLLDAAATAAPPTPLPGSVAASTSACTDPLSSAGRPSALTCARPIHNVSHHMGSACIGPADHCKEARLACPATRHLCSASTAAAVQPLARPARQHVML